MWLRLFRKKSVQTDRRELAVNALESAQNVLKNAGWTRGALRDHKGSVCLLGALRDVSAPVEAYNAVAKTLFGKSAQQFTEEVERDPYYARDLARWNDYYAEGITQVLNILDLAKKRV